MSTRTLTVARLVEDHIDGVEVEGDAFGDLLDSLGIVPKIEHRAIVRSEKAGDPETRAYIISAHRVPGHTYPACAAAGGGAFSLVLCRLLILS